MNKHEMNKVLANKGKSSLEITFDLKYLKNTWVNVTDNSKKDIYLKNIPETLVVNKHKFLSSPKGIIIENLGELPTNINLNSSSIFAEDFPVYFLPWSIIKRIDKIPIQKIKIKFE